MNLREIYKSLWTISPQLNYLSFRKKIHHFSKRGLTRKPRSNVFVLSTGRTGTLTLARTIALSNDCLAFHEPSPRLFGLSKLCYFKTPSKDFLDVFGEAFISARENFLNLSSELGRNYVETSPQITFLAKAIHKMLPDAKFIHMVRDPYAVVRSMMRRKWYSGNSYDKFRISPKSNQPYYDKWSQMTNFEKNIWLWAETNQWIMDFTITLPEGKKLFIKAEELFMCKENALKRLFKFVDSSKPPKKKIIQLLRKKLNAQVNGHFPEPARWTPEMRNQMNHIAGKIATKLGYNL